MTHVTKVLAGRAKVLRTTVAGLVLAVGGGLVVSGPAAPAGAAEPAPGGGSEVGSLSADGFTTASWDTLCTGYAGCRAAGYSDAGYGAANGQMYWRMYSGHNCTNYVAYRMIKAGAPVERPWSSTGMAYNWGFANASITDQRPSVGAVAWWNRNTGGIGSSGHVAYVERVVSPNEIIVSEDSWSGDFDWRRITRSSGSWPSGFVHFVDARTTTNTKAPVIKGQPRVGEPLTAFKGHWRPQPIVRFRYQWLAGGRAIPGATAQTYTPTVDDVRRRLTVKVTAKGKGNAPATVSSQPSTLVGRGELATETAPVLTGNATRGETLRVEDGTWSRTPDEVKYAWFADDVRLGKAHGPTLEVPGRFAGREISAVVFAHREGFRPSRVEAGRVGPVVLGDVVAQQRPTLEGRARLGQRLSVDPGSYAPSRAEVTFRWLRDGVAMPGETSRHYDLRAEDLGSHITVRVAARSKNRNAAVTTLGPETTVTSTARMRVRAVGGSRSARVSVRVRADRVDSPGGQVRVSVGGRTTWVDVVDGRAVVRVRRLRPGPAVVSVAYSGSATTSHADGRDRVRVRR